MRGKSFLDIYLDASICHTSQYQKLNLISSLIIHFRGTTCGIKYMMLYNLSVISLICLPRHLIQARFYVRAYISERSETTILSRRYISDIPY